MFRKFIDSNGKIKPECFGPACDYCFQKDFCHNFLKNKDKEKQDFPKNIILE